MRRAQTRVHKLTMMRPNDFGIGFTAALGLFRRGRGIDMPLPCVRTDLDRRVSDAR
jgi:hypothetical protein